MPWIGADSQTAAETVALSNLTAGVTVQTVAAKWLTLQNLATLKKRESGVWVAHTGATKARVSGAWVPAKGKRWNGSAWVNL